MKPLSEATGPVNSGPMESDRPMESQRQRHPVNKAASSEQAALLPGAHDTRRAKSP